VSLTNTPNEENHIWKRRQKKKSALGKDNLWDYISAFEEDGDEQWFEPKISANFYLKNENGFT
jgi:hypothetical protein